MLVRRQGVSRAGVRPPSKQLLSTFVQRGTEFYDFKDKQSERFNFFPLHFSNIQINIFFFFIIYVLKFIRWVSRGLRSSFIQISEQTNNL